MNPVNMLEAKSSLSSLVEAIEQGAEKEIVIVRNGRPVAKLVAVENSLPGQRIGIASGAFEVPDSIDESNDEAAKLFFGAVKA